MSASRRRSAGIILLGLAALVCILFPSIDARSQDCSWSLGKCKPCVNDHLLRLEQQCQTAPGPNQPHPSGCGPGYRILKSIAGCNDYLFIPFQRLSGVEDPQLQKPQAPNYWAIAWSRARNYVPCHDIGLAINSRCGRTENQLHIHMSCVPAELRSFLNQESSRITQTWSEPKDILHYGSYRLIRIDNNTNPFRQMLTIPGAQNNTDWKEKETLILIPVSVGSNDAGFYLLAGRCDGITSCGFGEHVLDKRAVCK
jgi:CDP-diacylglycerol pyrophosphatase